MSKEVGNKGNGLQNIDTGLLDFYSNVNSRRQSNAYGIQQKIDAMREAMRIEEIAKSKQKNFT